MMRRPSLDADTIAALKERQIAFFTARLASEAARVEWRANLEAGFRALLATPVARLLDASKVGGAINSALGEGAVRDGAIPAVRAALMLGSARLREDRRKLGELVPDESLAAIDRLLESPRLMPERLLREVLLNEAVEEVMRDVLFEALTEFSEKVNPFVADWGLPALLGKLSPFGLGGMKKAFESARGDFDRRIEPEIRKFLQGFSRRAMRTTVDVMLAKQDTPKFIALRKQIARWVLDQEVADVVAEQGDARAEQAQAIALAVGAHVASMERTRAEVRAVAEMAILAHGKQPLGEALAVYGVTHAPDFDALADATWPVVVEMVGSAPVRAWIEKLVVEFWDGLDGAGA